MQIIDVILNHKNFKICSLGKFRNDKNQIFNNHNKLGKNGVIMLGEPLYTYYILSLEPSRIPKYGNVHVLFDLDEILNVYFSISRFPHFPSI